MQLRTLLTTSYQFQDYALTFIRIGIGIIYIVHGGIKLSHGSAEWLWLGSQMKNLGITWWPLFWGLAATMTEFCGGIFLMLGFCTRLAATLMACTMFVAFLFHFHNQDPWGKVSFPLSMFIVFIGLAIAGSKSYSIDAYIVKS